MRNFLDCDQEEKIAREVGLESFFSQFPTKENTMKATKTKPQKTQKPQSNQQQKPVAQKPAPSKGK